ncbi:extracellular solute-binding protein [Patescibacteria group bacterium]|nr:extracellular solute-binding protein [Patescibacteria group bacterium]
MKKIFIASVLVLLTLSGAICKTTSPEVAERTKPIQLNYWRVFDDSDAFSELIAAYNQLHPNINITYRKLRYEEFEQKLLDALAEDRGPDLFSLHNTWLRGYQSKLLPLPDTISIPYRTVQGTIKKDVVWTLDTKKTISEREIQTNFIDQVAQDVIIPTYDETSKSTKKLVYGLPLSVDTMALFYNKELLNAAGIAEPAKDWQTFQEHVKKLTKQAPDGSISIAGAAIGSAENIERSTDIASVLMMQNGAKMTDDAGRATFNLIPAELSGRTMPPGAEALTFYTDFASPQKEVYTWNEAMQNSLNTFIQGRVAYFFGYAYHIPTIKAQAPKLQYGIAKLPQISGNQEINFANYWVEVVSKKTQYPDETWDFIQFITNQDNVEKYLNKTVKPTALRGLIQKQSEDATLYTFVSQLLTAKSWYKGKDALSAETAIKEMIKDVVSGARTVTEAIDFAIKKLDQTI